MFVSPAELNLVANEIRVKGYSNALQTDRINLIELE